MAAPTPSTSSPLSAIETPPTVGALSSILAPTEQQLLSPLPISPLLSSAISGASTSSAPTGQSTLETIGGYAVAAILVILGVVVAVAGSPKILKVAGATAALAA